MLHTNCHQLNTLINIPGAIAVSSGVFGDDMNSVRCSGDEDDILSCSYVSGMDCSEHSASVICQSTDLQIISIVVYLRNIVYAFIIGYRY